MSSDLSYRLVVDMSVRGSLAPQLEQVGARAGTANDALAKIGDTARSAASSVASAFTSAVEKVASFGLALAKVSAVAAGGALAYGVGRLNAELETTQTSLGAILNAQGISATMPEALGRASTVMRDMRKDAAALPGEFKDLIQFFRLGATPAFQQGASVDRLEKMSANAMAAAVSTGVQVDQASREFAQLLQGRAGAHNVFGSMLGFTGDKAEAFNRSSGEDRLKALETALGQYEDAIAAFGDTFDAQSSTLKDNLSLFAQQLTAPLFGRVKDVMKDANGWFERNEDRVEYLASVVGNKLVTAFDLGRRKLEEWGPVLATFAQNAFVEIQKIWSTIGPAIERIEPIVKKALADPATFDRIEQIAKLYAGVKVGGVVAPALNSAGGAVTSIGSGIAALAGEGGGAAALGGAGIMAGAGAATLAVVALVQLESALQVLADTTSVFHATAVHAWTNIQQRAGSAFEHLAHVWERIEPAVTAVAEAYGTFVLQSLDLFVTVGEQVAIVIDKITARLAILLDPYGAPSPGRPARHDASEVLRPAPERKSADEDVAPKTKTGAGGGGGGTTIQKVEIVVSSNQDPSRIARLTVDRLQDISRFPTSSPKTRNWSANRG